jgi:mycoredoxin
MCEHAGQGEPKMPPGLGGSLVGPLDAMTDAITLYSTSWCGYCRRLKRQLEGEGIAFREVDLDEAPETGARIVATTGGFRTVPAVEIGEKLLVNPSIEEIRTEVRQVAED